MKLIIMRHAEAEPAGVVPGGDNERRLTATGRTDAARMAQLAAGTRWPIAEIRTSPLARTRETGSIVSDQFRQLRERDPKVSDPQLLVEPRLAPGFDLEPALEILDELGSSGIALWVFHAPDVQRLAAALVGAREEAFYFTPGAMLVLNLPLPRPLGRAMIVWQNQPEYIRELF